MRRVPLGLLGEPCSPGARVAVRRPALVAPRDDRPSRGRDHAPRTWLGPPREPRAGTTFRRRYGMPYRLARRIAPAGTGSGLPRRRRRPPPRARQRVGGVSERSSFANFTTPLLLDDDEAIRAALLDALDLDADAIVGSLDIAAVAEAYQRDRPRRGRRQARPPSRRTRPRPPIGPFASRRRRSSSSATARGSSPAGGSRSRLRRLIANLEPGLSGIPLDRAPAPLLEHFPDGLTTAEVASPAAAAPTPLRTAREPSAHCSTSWRGSRPVRSARTGRTLARRVT